VEQEEAVVARQHHVKHVFATMNNLTTVEDTVVSIQSMPNLYDDNQQQQSSHAERLTPLLIKEEAPFINAYISKREQKS
jgi:hypothetical protein